jgi:putative spermidine/putrescine transport system permease protein
MTRSSAIRGSKLPLRITAGAVYVFLMLPIVVVALTSFNEGEYLKFPPDGFSLKWYGRFFGDATFMGSLWLSLEIGAMSALASTLIGAPAAIYCVRYAGRLRELVRLLLLLPLLLPEILTAIALLFFYYGIGIGTKTQTGLVIGHILITLPFAFLNVVSALYGIDRSIEEAARTLGAKPWTVFRRITLPLIKPGVINGATFAFIVSFDTFSISLLLKGIGTTTLPIQLFDYIKYYFDPVAAAVSTISMVVTLGVVLITDRLVGLRLVRF